MNVPLVSSRHAETSEEVVSQEKIASKSDWELSYGSILYGAEMASQQWLPTTANALPLSGSCKVWSSLVNFSP
ncbi:hypothetical protein MIZ01_1341 [Sideroxyarcus emersonii]|uniref:Uncharacterized protein n=1 Tax=Sideroxyarcus emersonii TaxID=2764705 RepID=A0AAN1XAG8_9PROT|nr:hypothetical protein MIZ01_1341 [Sideroxyarcus emersonii]